MGNAECKTMKLFCAIAMCSVAWADIANLEQLTIECSNGPRSGRLGDLREKLRVGSTDIATYEKVLISLSVTIEKINTVIMEHKEYQGYARKLLQMQFLLGAIAELKKAEGEPAPGNQITVKQALDQISSAIYVLPEIILAIEILEKDLENGNIARLRDNKELLFEEIHYDEFIAYIKLLGIHKAPLLSIMKNLQDIKTPLFDATTEIVCSTRRAHELAGMSYRE